MVYINTHGAGTGHRLHIYRVINNHGGGRGGGFFPTCMDQYKVAQRAEATEAECSLTSCVCLGACFRIGSHTMPGSRSGLNHDCKQPAIKYCFEKQACRIFKSCVDGISYPLNRSVNITGEPPDLTLHLELNERTIDVGSWQLELTNEVGAGHVNFSVVFTDGK